MDRTKMTAEQKVKWIILLEHFKDQAPQLERVKKLRPLDIEEEFSDLEEDDELGDAREFVYFNATETNIRIEPADFRHDHWATSHAAQCPNGDWVGWVCHSPTAKNFDDPSQDMVWIANAYNIHVTGEEVVTKQLFAKGRDETISYAVEFQAAVVTAIVWPEDDVGPDCYAYDPANPHQDHAGWWKGISDELKSVFGRDPVSFDYQIVTSQADLREAVDNIPLGVAIG